MNIVKLNKLINVNIGISRFKNECLPETVCDCVRVDLQLFALLEEEMRKEKMNSACTLNTRQNIYFLLV